MKKNYITAGICAVLFVLIVVLVKNVDVAAIGPCGTEIGLSTINGGYHSLTGVHMTVYDITNVMGFVSIAMVGIFGMMGLIQWIQRKNILKVDREILAMGIMFLILLALYIVFQNAVVSYRPVLMPGKTEPEPSFPSSHTMMTLVVLGSIIMVIGNYVKSRSLCRLIRIAAAIVMLLMIVGRLMCGVHWLTDIAGGILLSITLLELYYALK